MGNYSMPGYFQTMPVAPGKAFRPSPENVAELRRTFMPRSKR